MVVFSLVVAGPYCPCMMQLGIEMTINLLAFYVSDCAVRALV